MNIKSCKYNQDTGYLESIYPNSFLLILNCSQVEESLVTTPNSRAKLQWLLDNEPITYFEMALESQLQSYCLEVDKNFHMQNNLIMEQLLNSGYSEDVAQRIIDEFNRYDN